MTDALTLESEAKTKDICAKAGLQYRTLLYLIPMCTLPGRTTPLRQPEDDGKAGRLLGYPRLPLLSKGSPVPTNLIGFATLRSRRTVTETLASLASHGLAVGRLGGRTGNGLNWKPTKAGKEVFEELLTTFNNDGRAFTGYDIDGFDAEGYDPHGVNYSGWNKAGEYVGIQHIFTHYYGKTYFGSTADD